MPGDEFELVPIDDQSAALLEEYVVIKDGDALGHSEAEGIESAALLRQYAVIDAELLPGHSEAEAAEAAALLREYAVIDAELLPGHSDAEAAEAEARDPVIVALLEEYEVVGTVGTDRAELDVWSADRLDDAFNSAVSRTYSRWTAPHLAPVPSGPPPVGRQLVPLAELDVAPVRVPSDELGLTEATMADFMTLYPGD